LLVWDARRRPPAAVADVTRLPLGDRSIDDTVAAFVYNHLTQPELALGEAAGSTHPGGALLACVYANASRSEVRDAHSTEAARAEGWHTPDWYIEIKHCIALLSGFLVGHFVSQDMDLRVDPISMILCPGRDVTVTVNCSCRTSGVRISELHEVSLFGYFTRLFLVAPVSSLRVRLRHFFVL